MLRLYRSYRADREPPARARGQGEEDRARASPRTECESAQSGPGQHCTYGNDAAYGLLKLYLRHRGWRPLHVGSFAVSGSSVCVGWHSPVRRSASHCTWSSCIAKCSARLPGWLPSDLVQRRQRLVRPCKGATFAGREDPGRFCRHCSSSP